MRRFLAAWLTLALSGFPAFSAVLPDMPPAGASETADQPGLKIDREALRAMRDFELRCAGCHSLGAGAIVGPDLAGVTVRRSSEWLIRWLSAPQSMLETDAQARALLAEYGTRMPDPKLGEEDVRRFIRYFRWFDARPAAH